MLLSKTFPNFINKTISIYKNIDLTDNKYFNKSTYRIFNIKMYNKNILCTNDLQNTDYDNRDIEEKFKKLFKKIPKKYYNSVFYLCIDKLRKKILFYYTIDEVNNNLNEYIDTIIYKVEH